MRALPLLVVVAALSCAEPAAASSLSREPILRTLRKASPAVSACSARYVLPGGRYGVRLTILAGRAREVTLVTRPGLLSEPARACLGAAFAVLQYPELGSLEDGTPETYLVTYPFVLVADAPARVRPRPARLGIRGKR